ncbi:syntaxin-4 isoform X4 [Pteropus medius]|uniref:Syntaxin-4 n=1 Tax=Pteropus vampyrus TaxID=132908 RepID=A0A6P6BSZ5_PTEVA|nr:syntaxin-4 isoform X4 [Pteropus vampyrus]XP_039740398.1 syntaxin-4 isoform X4 [Pteropus giganteus]
MTPRMMRTRSGSHWWYTRAHHGWGTRTMSSSRRSGQFGKLLSSWRIKSESWRSSRSPSWPRPFPRRVSAILGMKQDLQNLREEIKQLGREIRGQLKAIEPQKEEADESYYSVNMRMRKTQHGVLSQQFVELINKCNSMQSEYREKNVERIRRQLKITNAGMVSDEELEQMLDSGQSEVFVSNILKDTQVTRQALNEISARHSEIQQLERSIRELHEIFTFLATEVEMQGEMINRIEKNILSSADYVERGQEHVRMALENQKKARKKKVLIAVCVSITVLILAVIICVSLLA